MRHILLRKYISFFNAQSHSKRMAHLGRAGTFWAVAGATFTAVNCGTAAARGKVCYCHIIISSCLHCMMHTYMSEAVCQQLRSSVYSKLHGDISCHCIEKHTLSLLCS
jgi:hypothetical protein